MQEKHTKYPQGMKWTKQRRDVYDVLFQAGEPLNAHQIYQRIVKQTQVQEASEKDAGNYAVSTIYRILAAFEEKELVTKSNWMGSGTIVYELNKGSHKHYAVCLSCHRHIPMHVCPFEHMHLQETEDGFQVTGHKLELYGYCKECRTE